MTIPCWALVLILGERGGFCCESGGVGSDVVNGDEMVVGNDGFGGDVVDGVNAMVDEV